MRIVHVVYSFDVGGMEKGIATMIRNGTPEFEHVIVCMSRAGRLASELPSNTTIVELDKPAGHSFLFQLRLARLLHSLRPDVVHTRNWVGMDGIVGARIAGITAVVHGEHGWGMDDRDGSNPRRIRVRRLLSRWVREYTCVSRQMVSWMRDTVGIRKPITQVYNGIDTDCYQPAEDATPIRASIGVDPGAIVFGTIGRLDPIKNYTGLIRAFSDVQRTFPGAVLVIVGDGAERSSLEATIRELDAPVRMLGDRSDAHRILRAMDVFVLPSFNEGISNTILEAMATGLPVIASDVGGNPELVENRVSGILTAVDNHDALVAAMTHYAGNRAERIEHGANGRRLAERRFSVGRMIQAYEDVWHRTAVSNAGRGHAHG